MNLLHAVFALPLLALGGVTFLTAEGNTPAAFAASGNSTIASSEPIACELRVDRTGGIGIEALAKATRAVSGSYRLTVSKRSAGGTSDITQGGDFSAKPGEQVLLGQVGIDGGAFTAKLSLETSLGQASCTAQS